MSISKAAATPEEQKKLSWISEGIEAKLSPKDIPASEQQNYSGSYGEQRTVVAREGKPASTMQFSREFFPQ